MDQEKSANLQILEGIISNMNLNLSIEEKIKEGEICYYINGEKASQIIGHRGETLDALQYLMNQIVNKENSYEEYTRVSVDADFYRERRIRTLISLANKLSHQAFNTKKEVELEPMNSYERRIIHSALQDSEEATTRSEGEGKFRHIIVVPNVEQINYGSSTEFKKKGPTRTKSFGYDKRKF